MPRVRKCLPDCTCHRHRKCPEGCTCNRHKGVFCGPDCACDRHNMRKCAPDCTCGKHSAELTYSGRHYRVRKEQGNASAHFCVECGGRAREWAQIHGADGTDPQNDYRPMCARCHRAYDGNTAKAIAANTGRKLTPERREQRAEIMRRWNASLTPEQRSENTRKAWQTRRAQKVGD